MANQAIPLADAVAVAINAKSDYSNGLIPNAQRRLLVNLKDSVENIKSLSVYTSPGAFTSLASARKYFDEDQVINVFVFDAIDRISNTNLFNEDKVETLLNFVHEVQTQILEYADANPTVLKTLGLFANNPLMDGEHTEQGIFLSVTEFTFRTCRVLS